MPAKKKSAPKRKASAPKKRQSVVPKKQQSVAAKKKHVRELAKAGRWAEIEKLYGKKIVAKARTYAEKQRVTKTPQEIAREILLKNGYLPSAPQAEAASAAAGRSTGQTEVLEPTARVDKSPDTLTKAQQELIETRRRDALERRRRAQQVAQPNVVPPDRVEAAVLPRGRPPVGPDPELHRPRPRQTRTEAGRCTTQVHRTTHRVVTPENLPTTNPVVEAEQVRPEFFWDDLEAAAEIVQWENEHLAEVTIKQPTTPQRDSRGAMPPAVSRISSLSQEIAAAAEIIQWEKEHEVPEETACSRQGHSSSSDTELEAPQFQLMPVDVTDELMLHEQKGSEALGPEAATRTAQPIKSLQPEPKPQHKRPLEAMAPPALPRSSTVSNGPSRAGDSTPSRSPQDQQRNPTAAFIDKHLLDDKLELPVLEFLDMMLA